MRINRIDEYEMYLKKQLGKYIKDKKKLEIVVQEMMIVFRDGIKFGRCELEIKI